MWNTIRLKMPAATRAFSFSRYHASWEKKMRMKMSARPSPRIASKAGKAMRSPDPTVKNLGAGLERMKQHPKHRGKAHQKPNSR
jgi:hypothetical protein